MWEWSILSTLWASRKRILIHWLILLTLSSACFLIYLDTFPCLLWSEKYLQLSQDLWLYCMKTQSKYFQLIHVKYMWLFFILVWFACVHGLWMCYAHTCLGHRLPFINYLPCFLRQGLSLTFSSPISAANSRKHQDILFSAGFASLCVLIWLCIQVLGIQIHSGPHVCVTALNQQSLSSQPNVCNLSIISNLLLS